MSEDVQEPPSGDDKPVARDSGSDDANTSGPLLRRFRPRIALQSLFSQAQRYYPSHETRNYYRQAIKNAGNRAWRAGESVGYAIRDYVGKAWRFLVWCFSKPNRAIAVFTGAMLATTIFQWQAMKNQNVEMAKQSDLLAGQLEVMRRDQGAWISVGTPTMNFFPEKDGKIELTTTLRNLGKSQAFVRYADLHAQTGQAGTKFTEEAVLGDIKTKAPAYSLFMERALAPGKEMEVNLTIAASSMDEFSDAMKGTFYDSKKWVYIFVRVTYDDPLGESHSKAFCFVYVNDIKTAMPWPLSKRDAN